MPASTILIRQEGSYQDRIKGTEGREKISTVISITIFVHQLKNLLTIPSTEVVAILAVTIYVDSSQVRRL